MQNNYEEKLKERISEINAITYYGKLSENVLLLLAAYALQKEAEAYECGWDDKQPEHDYFDQQRKLFKRGLIEKADK